jgi:hypothetical protein|tara:strand:+ start:108 stop:1028 length:921 start_codon:yes stop_codon:yes gene_type:complete
MKQEVYDRFKDYKKQHCWQYEIRQQNLKQDLKEAGLTSDERESLRIEDFEFCYVDKSDKETCESIKRFIERHEWLGKLPARPTQRFIARLKKNGTIAGAIVMATPNSFSHILGRENRDKEKLISRGACISWAPKNLGSWLIMKSIKWMVKNTDYRIFSAYSDPEAKELGTIYQACNFYYLGQKSGTLKQYFDPSRPHLGWFSDRDFRKRSKYKLYAQSIGLTMEEWNGYMKKYSPNWEIMPEGLKEKIKSEEKKYRDSCQNREMPPKHKYVYILGRSKKETKELKKLFDKFNPDVVGLEYPSERGK